MSSQKEHAPSATRLRKLREEGQIPSLTPTIRAVVFATVALALIAGGPSLFGLWCDYCEALFSLQLADEVYASLRWLGLVFSLLLVALVLPANLLAWILNSFHFRLLNIAPQLQRLRPFQAWKQRWSRWTIFSGTLGASPALVGIVVLWTGVRAGESDPFALVARGLRVAALVSVALALAEYGLQQVAFRARNRMSTQDLREEHKNAEGSPENRSRLARERERAARQPPVSVARKASFIVRNPTRLCCAIGHGANPAVLATGRGPRAKALVRHARRAGVPEVVDRPLALALLECDEGATVPDELIALIHRLQRWSEDERRREPSPQSR